MKTLSETELFGLIFNREIESKNKKLIIGQDGFYAVHKSSKCVYFGQDLSIAIEIYQSKHPAGQGK